MKFQLFNIDKSILLLFNSVMEPGPEYFTYMCPHCSTVRNAAEVAAELPDEVLRLAAGRRNAHRRQIRLAGRVAQDAHWKCPRRN